MTPAGVAVMAPLLSALPTPFPHVPDPHSPAPGLSPELLTASILDVCLM